MLSDEGTDSHSGGRPGYELILVSGECHARASELRDSLSLGPPTNAAIKGQSWCGSTLRSFRLNVGEDSRPIGHQMEANRRRQKRRDDLS